MPKRPKYRPNLHLEPLYDSHFTVMEILLEKPSEIFPSPVEGQTIIDDDLNRYKSVDATQDVDEKLHTKEKETPIEQKYTFEEIPEPSLENVPEDILVYIKNLQESITSLQKENKTSKEENAFKIQFCERLQTSNNECIDLMVELRDRIRYLETFEKNGQNPQAGETRRCVLELKEIKEECNQLRQDLDRFDNALKVSRVKVSLLECDVDFYKNEVECLQKTIRELQQNQNGPSVDQKMSFPLEAVQAKPTEIRLPRCNPVSERSNNEDLSIRSASSLGECTSQPSLPRALNRNNVGRNIESLPVIPKLNLSEIGSVDSELTEPIRSRDEDSPPRPKAPKLLTSLNDLTMRDTMDPFSCPPKVIPIKKKKITNTKPVSLFLPIKASPDSKIHQPQIVRKPENISNKSSIKRRELILPTLSLRSSKANLQNEKGMKTPKQSSCVLLPPLLGRPSQSQRREHKDNDIKKRNFRF